MQSYEFQGIPAPRPLERARLLTAEKDSQGLNIVLHTQHSDLTA